MSNLKQLTLILPSLYFKNNSLGNIVKILGENYFYHLSQELDANILRLVKKKAFFPMSIAIALEFLMKFYLAKKHFLTNREISDEDKIKKKKCYDLESI